MENENNIGLFLSISIACLALLATLLAVRYQIITIINSQMLEKAKECNSNLDENGKLDEANSSKVSGVVSAIITARQLLDLQLRCKKYHILLFTKRQYFVDQFYLQLHTSIREWIDLERKDQKDISQIIQNQKASSYTFLKKSIVKDLKRRFH